MWVDGVYVKAGLEREKAAILVVMAALSDGSKVVVSAVPGYSESTRSWSEVLRDLRDRGLNCPRLVVGDGHLGIWGALRNVWPEAGEQRCWNHKILNVFDKLPKRQHDQARLMLRNLPYAETRAEAVRLRKVFTRWCGDHSYDAASEAIERDWERMVTSYDYPREHCGTFVRPTRWNRRSRRCGSGPMRPGATRGGQSDSGHMEDVDGGREEVPPVAGARTDGGRLPRAQYVDGIAVEGYGREGRRLITFTPLLTQPPRAIAYYELSTVMR